MRTENTARAPQARRALPLYEGLTHTTADVGECTAASFGDFACTALSGLAQLSATARDAGFSAVLASANAIGRHERPIEKMAAQAVGLAYVGALSGASVVIAILAKQAVAPLAFSLREYRTGHVTSPEVAREAAEIAVAGAMLGTVIAARLMVFGQGDTEKIGRHALALLDQWPPLDADQRAGVAALTSGP